MGGTASKEDETRQDALANYYSRWESMHPEESKAHLEDRVRANLREKGVPEEDLDSRVKEVMSKPASELEKLGGARDDLLSKKKSKAKEDLARAIVRDVLPVVGVKKVPEDVGKAVSLLKSKIPSRKGKNGVKSNKAVHNKVCKALAKSINKNYGKTVVREDEDPHEQCAKVDEVLNSLVRGLHGEFLAVYADLEVSIENLQVIIQFLESVVERFNEIARESQDAMSREKTKMVVDYAKRLLSEARRQLAVISNLVGTTLDKQERTILDIVHSTGEDSEFLRRIKEPLGSPGFSSKVLTLLGEVSSVANAATLVQKALDTVGLKLKDFEEAKSPSDLRTKLLASMERKSKGGPVTPQMLDNMIQAEKILFRNRSDLRRKEIVDYLKRAKTGGDMSYTSRKQSLKYRLKRQDRFRETLFADFEKNFRSENTKLAKAVRALAKEVTDGKIDGDNKDLIRFQRAFNSVSLNDRMGLAKALSGYYKGSDVRSLRNEFITSVEAARKAAKPLVSKSHAMKEIDDLLERIVRQAESFRKFFGDLLSDATIHPRRKGGAKKAKKRKSKKKGGKKKGKKRGGSGDDTLVVEVDMSSSSESESEDENESMETCRECGRVECVCDEQKHAESDQEEKETFGGGPGCGCKRGGHECPSMELGSEKCECKSKKVPEEMIETYMKKYVSKNGGAEYESIKQAKLDLQYYIHMSNMKKSMKMASRITEEASKGYKETLGRSIGELLQEEKDLAEALKKNLKNAADKAKASANVGEANASVAKCDDLPVSVRAWLTGRDPTNITNATGVPSTMEQIEQGVSALCEFVDCRLKAVQNLMLVAQNVDLMLLEFTKNVTSHPEAVEDLKKLLSQVVNVKQYFNEQSGNALVEVFENLNLDDPVTKAVKIKEIKNNGEHYFSGSVMTKPTGDDNKEYANIENQAGKPAEPANEPADALGKNSRGVPVAIRKDREDTSKDREDKPLPKGREAITEAVKRTSKVYTGARMLENIIAMFAKIGSKFGDKGISDEQFLSFGQMHKYLKEYMAVSSWSLPVCTYGKDKNPKESISRELRNKSSTAETVKLAISAHVSDNLAASEMSVNADSDIVLAAADAVRAEVAKSGVNIVLKNLVDRKLDASAVSTGNLSGNMDFAKYMGAGFPATHILRNRGVADAGDFTDANARAAFQKDGSNINYASALLSAICQKVTGKHNPTDEEVLSAVERLPGMRGEAEQLAVMFYFLNTVKLNDTIPGLKLCVRDKYAELPRFVQEALSVIFNKEVKLLPDTDLADLSSTMYDTDASSNVVVSENVRRAVKGKSVDLRSVFWLLKNQQGVRNVNNVLNGENVFGVVPNNDFTSGARKAWVSIMLNTFANISEVSTLVAKLKTSGVPNAADAKRAANLSVMGVDGSDIERLVSKAVKNAVERTSGAPSVYNKTVPARRMVLSNTEGLSCFEKYDEIFLSVVKAMAAKVMSTIDLYKVFKMPSSMRYFSTQNTLRLVLGGADEPSSSSVSIIPEAFEMYIRITLLMEWYNDLFSHMQRTGVEKNSEDDDVAGVITLVPDISGTWSECFDLFFKKVNHVTDGNYGASETRRIIRVVNRLYTHFRKSAKSPEGVAIEACLSLIEEVNRRYGILRKEDFIAYRNARKERYNAQQNLFDEPEKDLSDYDILDEKNDYGRGSAPSDKFYSGMEQALMERAQFKPTVVRNIVHEFREQIAKALEINKMRGERATIERIGMSITFDDSLSQHRKALDVAKSAAEKERVVQNAIRSVGDYGTLGGDKYLLFQDLVIEPLKALSQMRILLSALTEAAMPVDDGRKNDLWNYVLLLADQDLVTLTIDKNKIVMDLSGMRDLVTALFNSIKAVVNDFRLVLDPNYIQKFERYVKDQYPTLEKYVRDHAGVGENVRTQTENSVLYRSEDLIKDGLFGEKEEILGDDSERSKNARGLNAKLKEVFFGADPLYENNNKFWAYYVPQVLWPMGEEVKVRQGSLSSQGWPMNILKSSDTVIPADVDTLFKLQAAQRKGELIATPSSEVFSVTGIVSLPGRGLVAKFNSALRQYLSNMYDAASGKIYAPIVEDIVGRTFGSAILNGNAIPDVVATRSLDGDEGVRSFRLGFPAVDGLVYASTARGLRVLAQRSQKGGESAHLVQNLSELSQNVREKMRNFLAYHDHVFEGIEQRADLLREALIHLVHANSADLSKTAFEASGIAVSRADFEAAVRESREAAPMIANSLSESLKGSPKTYLQRMLENIAEFCRNVQSTIKNVQAELDVYPEYMQTFNDSLKLYKQEHGSYPLTPVSYLAYAYRYCPDRAQYETSPGQARNLPVQGLPGDAMKTSRLIESLRAKMKKASDSLGDVQSAAGGVPKDLRDLSDMAAQSSSASTDSYYGYLVNSLLLLEADTSADYINKANAKVIKNDLASVSKKLARCAPALCSAAKEYMSAYTQAIDRLNSLDRSGSGSESEKNGLLNVAYNARVCCWFLKYVTVPGAFLCEAFSKMGYKKSSGDPDTDPAGFVLATCGSLKDAYRDLSEMMSYGRRTPALEALMKRYPVFEGRPSGASAGTENTGDVLIKLNGLQASSLANSISAVSSVQKLMIGRINTVADKAQSKKPSGLDLYAYASSPAEKKEGFLKQVLDGTVDAGNYENVAGKGFGILPFGDLDVSDNAKENAMLNAVVGPLVKGCFLLVRQSDILVSRKAGEPFTGSQVIIPARDSAVGTEYDIWVVTDGAGQGDLDKYIYGVRAVLFGKGGEAAMPGVASMLRVYNAMTSSSENVTPAVFWSAVNRYAKLARWLTDTERFRLSLATHDSSLYPSANMAALYNEHQPIQSFAGSLQHALPEILYTVEGGDLRENKETVIDWLLREDETLKAFRDKMDSRKNARMYNILDANLVPINVNALMRDLPLANLLNYSHSFSECVKSIFHAHRIAGPCDAPNYSMPDSSRPEAVLVQHLVNPRRTANMEKDALLLAQLYMSGFGVEGLGRPKFNSDQVWGKALLGQVMPIAELDSLRQAALYSGQNQSDGQWRLSQSTRNGDLHQLLYPHADKNEKNTDWSGESATRMRQGVSLAAGAHGEDLVRERAQERVNTYIVQNLTWLNNIQRVMWWYVNQTLKGRPHPLIRSSQLARPDNANYSGDQMYDDGEYEVSL